MRKSSSGAVIVGLVTALINSAALAATAKVAKGDVKKLGSRTAKKVEMVKCYSATCGGKFEYKGTQNSCDQISDAMEVPKSICDPKKGLKIVSQ